MVGSRTRSGSVRSRLLGSTEWRHSHTRLLGCDYDGGTVQRVHLVLPLRRTPLIAVVQPSHLRNPDDLATAHDGAPFRRVFGKGQMRSRLVIVD